ncbi:CNNM domain-containing protein [Metabacillus sp. HB246100]|uniref:CNNM domain-containing protein n=1 Tax=Bacillus weihaiensis TaxID=1547283 RepID=UPI0023558522|nr:CNNM domain-containing protein [Bacillus weihaiensis]
MIIAILFFLFMSFFLSGSETALTAVNKMKIKSRADNDDKKSKKLLELVSKPDELITGILIGNNIANIMLPTLVTIIALEYGINVGVATGVLTIVLIIFAEVLPKSIAATFADKIAYFVYPVIKVILFVFKPLIFLLSRFTRIVINKLSKDEESAASISREELITMVNIATSEGILQNDETQRIKGAIDFYDLDVRDALKTPRTEIQGIACGTSFEEARHIVLNGSHTRYPVYKDNMDQIIGVLHSKSLLAWSLAPEKKLEDFIDIEPLFVFEFHSIEKVFKLMLKRQRHLAIVLDEYGGTKGIISHEDIIEAMIGQEIKDETDENEDILIHEITGDQMICNGKISLRRLNEVFDTKIPEQEDILAGFISTEIGRFPTEGEEYTYENLHFKVLDVEESKLKKIKITKLNLTEEL